MSGSARGFTPAMFDLSGRVALVTGGGKGIGAAIAAALAACGCTVAITARHAVDSDLIGRLAANGRSSGIYNADLGDGDEAAIRSLVDRVEADIGAIDILVNNAGLIRRAPAAEHSKADWDAAIGLNLTAPWLLSKEIGGRMLVRRSGKIVMIASMLSYQGGINVPGYTASKHAVVGMTKALANEWAGRGINVNAIAPGYVETNATSALRNDAGRSAEILGRIPAGRWGKPEDIAGSAVFLCSDASKYINGHTIAVDGGWLSR